MIFESRIGLNKTMILRLKVSQRDRAGAVFGQEHHGGASGIEEYADAPAVAVFEIGKVPRHGHRRGGIMMTSAWASSCTSSASGLVTSPMTALKDSLRSSLVWCAMDFGAPSSSVSKA